MCSLRGWQNAKLDSFVNEEYEESRNPAFTEEEERSCRAVSLE